MAHPIFIPLVVVFCIVFSFGIRVGHKFFDPMFTTGDEKADAARRRRVQKMDRVVIAAIWLIGLGVSIKLAT
jgi:hypothetical protein